MVSLRFNSVNEKDKIIFSVQIFKHLKLSQETKQKHTGKFAVNTNFCLLD